MPTPAHRVLAAAALALLLVAPLAGCGRDDASGPADPAPPVAEEPAPDEPDTSEPGETDPPAGSEIAWLDTELTDVLTGETFRISDFAGRPVLVKSFAVW